MMPTLHLQEILIESYNSYIVAITSTFIDEKQNERITRSARFCDKQDPSDDSQLKIKLLEGINWLKRVHLTLDAHKFVRRIEFDIRGILPKSKQRVGLGTWTSDKDAESPSERVTLSLPKKRIAHCLFGAFSSLLKAGINENVVALTGIGFALRRKPKKKMLATWRMKGLLDPEGFGEKENQAATRIQLRWRAKTLLNSQMRSARAIQIRWRWNRLLR